MIESLAFDQGRLGCYPCRDLGLQRSRALLHAPFQICVEGLDLNPCSCADADLPADGNPGDGQEDHTQQRAQRDDNASEMLRGAGALGAQLQQDSFGDLHLVDRQSHRIHDVFSLRKQRHCGDRPRVPSRGHDLFYVLDLGVRLLFKQVQSLFLIGVYQEKAQRVQILDNRRSS
jgi:hypothetical protein